MNQLHAQPILEVRQLRLSGPDGDRVRSFDLTLKSGDALALLGLNGAGKTTILKLLSGQLMPSGGEISVGGRGFITHPRGARAQIGVLPDTPPLYPELNVRRYLRYCAQLRAVPGGEVDQAVDRAITRCDLNGVVDKTIANLSKGFRQRLGIAQAIVHQPRLLLLDEPASGLDPAQIADLHALIGELREHSAVVLSTHSLDDAMRQCNQLAIVDQGAIILHLSRDQLLEQLSRESGGGPVDPILNDHAIYRQLQDLFAPQPLATST